MSQAGKKTQESITTMTEIVLPNDTNTLNNLRGGKILHWMDVASAITAGKHAEAVVVTASVDAVSFDNPIRLGDVVTIQAKMVRAFRTSMEVEIKVWAENIPTKTKYQSNTAYYTFVALDSNGRPTAVPAVIPETDEEKKNYDKAGRRRELRLIIAGRIKPQDAPDLKQLFTDQD
jgi:acyl-CoA hydrolase